MKWSKQLQKAGFQILRGEECFRPIRFFNVGALVWFARIIQWEFLNFSMDTHLENLLKAQRILDKQGSIDGSIHRFLLVAQKWERKMMIETDRLILRPFREGDGSDVFEYLKEPMVNCFACMKLSSLEEAKKAVQERAEDAEYTFAIVLKDTGRVIGEIDAHPESSQPDMAENFVKDTFSLC